MNNYSLKVSLIVLAIVNIALAAFVFYNNRGVTSFDDSRLPSVVTALKNDISEYAQKGQSKAQEYSDKISSKASTELKKASDKFDQFSAEMTKWRAETDKKIKKIEEASRK